jgi:type IV pilus assembly protein PilC
MYGLTAITSVLLVLYPIIGYRRPGLALATLPAALLALIYAAMEIDSLVTIYVIALLPIVTLAGIALSGRNTETRRSFGQWAIWLLLAVGGTLALIAIFVAFLVIGAGFILPLFFFLGIGVIVIALITYGAGSYRADPIHVFSVLGSSMKQNLPLPMALECAASGRSSGNASAMRGIKNWLVQGYSLAESIRRGYPQCPSRALAILSAAEPRGQLTAAIETVEADLKSRSAKRLRLQPVHAAYPLVILTIMFILLLGLMTFVIPQFKTVLEEMTGERLPAPTRVLISIMQTLVYSHDGLVGLGLFFLVFFVIPPLWVWARTRRRRPDVPFLLSRMGDWIKWHLPVLRWFENNGAMLQTVELLRISMRTDCPVNEAIRGTLELDVNQCFKRRLACWLARVERGDDIGQAARNCGLGSALAWAFDRNMGAMHAPAVLDMLESFYRSNYSYRVNLARFILWPLGIILLGATVGFVVFSVFAPGVAVLRSMAETVYP